MSSRFKRPVRAPGERRAASAGRYPAFTLIELLVVIAIIAILAAVLFPVFAQARDKARQAACLSNTKQIALGVQMYGQDYDETLPVAGTNGQLRGRWQYQVFPYSKNVDIYTCPNIPSNRWRPPAAGQLGQDDRGGYGWNFALGSDPPGAATASGYTLATIKKPAETIIVGDTGFDGTATQDVGWTMLAADPRKAPARTFNQPGVYPNFRHNMTQTAASAGGRALPIDGRANFAFLDGHSKSLAIGTAMQEPALAPNHQDPDVAYLLWNRN